jgi:hypothetical protein
MIANRHSSSGLSPDGDFGWVTSERRDILLDPLERQSLVSEPDISVPTVNDLLRTQEAPCRKTVVERNGDEWFA